MQVSINFKCLRMRFMSTIGKRDVKLFQTGMMRPTTLNADWIRSLTAVKRSQHFADTGYTFRNDVKEFSFAAMRVMTFLR